MADAAAMGSVLANERAALATSGGITDGSIAAGVRPSTPRRPADMRPARLVSRDPAAFPPVTGREEEWRFTPIERLRPLLAGPTSDARLQVKTELPAGVQVRELPLGDPLLATMPAAPDVLSALATTHAPGALLVRVAAGTESTEPVTVHLVGSGDGEVSWGHVILDVGAHARVTVVLEHSGLTTYAGNVSVLVGDGATLSLTSVHEWDAGTVHAGHTAFRLGRDASVRALDVTLGGDLVRLMRTVEYTAPGGDAELFGLAFADAAQHLEHRLFIEHAAPQCRSRVTYKSVVQGSAAHTVWVGDVLIRAEATGTDTYEINRNLLLTPLARADSVPNLEIETGEITGAGHASATGRFDDEQLFYLMSRGIDASTARRMVVRGFFNDLLAEAGVPSLEERLMAAVGARLGAGPDA